MRAFACVLLAALSSVHAAPSLLIGGLVAPAYHIVPSVVATGGSVPVAVGGYKAQAGEGGAVHEVPGLVPAPALVTQESEGGVSLTTGTGAYVTGHILGKRDADADPSYGYGVPSVPVSVGGYQAVAGVGGAVHIVPGAVPSPGAISQISAGGVSLTTGAGAPWWGKRSADAEPAADADADPSLLAYGAVPVVTTRVVYAPRVAYGAPIWW